MHGKSTIKKHSFKDGRFRQDFPPNEQIRKIIKLLCLWWKIRFNLKCQCMCQEQLSIGFLSCGMLRSVGWQFLTDVSRSSRSSSRFKHSRKKNLWLLDPWKRTNNLSRNVSSKLPISAVQLLRRAMNSTTARLKLETSHQNLPMTILSLVDV